MSNFEGVDISETVGNIIIQHHPAPTGPAHRVQYMGFSDLAASG